MRGNWLDRVAASVSPEWGARRLKARAVIDGVRHFEGAARTRRTEGWNNRNNYADSDVSMQGALALLRGRSRDLVRNNGWARRAQRVIANNAISWGIGPKAYGAQAKKAQAAWREWAGGKGCSVSKRQTFAGIQHLVMRALVESGEVLIRRRYRQGERREIALELAVLEADYLDSSKTATDSQSGGPIIAGVEFDGDGRRAGYWLFDKHPGSQQATGLSRFVPSMDVLHIYEEERPGQTRGVSWLAAAIVPLKDLGDLEDAELVKQKIAACFAALVTDPTGAGDAVGETQADPLLETLEPGTVSYLAPGREVSFANPPQATLDALPERTLRRVCAALGVTYEEVSGDWSRVNFSSARMARLAHWGNVHHWQQNIIIPQLCQPVWEWFVEAAWLAGALGNVTELPTAEWTAPPMPMLEPDKEGQAYSRLIRNGMLSLPAALREQGIDPDVQFEELEACNKELDRRGLVLDCDPRKVTTQGQGQLGAPGAAPQAKAPPQGAPPSEKTADDSGEAPVQE